jgi:hypothetical protein
METGLDPERNKVLGSLNPNNMAFDGITGTLEFEVISQGAQSTTLQGFHDTGAERAFRLSVVASNLPVIGTSALRPTLTIDIPPSLIEVERSIEQDDYLMQKISVQINNGSLMTATLINSIATI